MPSNRRRRRLQQQNYYRQNREKILLRRREKHADFRISSRSRTDYQWNEGVSPRKRRQMYNRSYYEKHKDSILAKQKVYYENNKGRFKQLRDKTQDSLQERQKCDREKNRHDGERAKSARKQERKPVGKRTLMDNFRVSPEPLEVLIESRW